jgi:hypothetical protein
LAFARSSVAINLGRRTNQWSLFFCEDLLAHKLDIDLSDWLEK